MLYIKMVRSILMRRERSAGPERSACLEHLHCGLRLRDGTHLDEAELALGLEDILLVALDLFVRCIDLILLRVQITKIARQQRVRVGFLDLQTSFRSQWIQVSEAPSLRDLPLDTLLIGNRRWQADVDGGQKRHLPLPRGWKWGTDLLEAAQRSTNITRLFDVPASVRTRILDPTQEARRAPSTDPRRSRRRISERGAGRTRRSGR
uniref:Uncharacterized protein n=1 Tax=Corethron hystrix TaxID=216773 RepID=A0A7S1FTB2_9STRA|mmetsp:Transcript_29318/g.67309  ORF Transcript_29318/g.67309 Transcript_29318/m.67309 type:complete len:206 (+) Transcript_29318:500-1117(+)